MNTTSDSTRRVALVIDDEPGFRAVAVRVMGRLGLEVVECANAREAGAALARESESLALLLVDGVLPDGTGEEFIEVVRKNGVTVPIVYISAFAKDDHELRRRLEGPLGVNAVLRKPIGLVPLLEALQKALSVPMAPEDNETSPSANLEGGMNELREQYAGRAAVQLWALKRAIQRMTGPTASDALARDAMSIAHRIHGSAGTHGFVELGVVARHVESAFARVVEGRSNPSVAEWEALAASLASAASTLEAVAQSHSTSSIPPAPVRDFAED